jgi:hypothetical protein
MEARLMLSNGSPGRVQLRKYSRLAVSFPVTFRVAGEKRICSGRSRDIGGGGMHFESDASVAKETRLTIWFALEPGSKLEVEGIVAATFRPPGESPHQYRVAFTGLTESARSPILSYVFEAWRAALLKQALLKQV